MKNVEKKKIPLAQETLGFFLQIRSDVAIAVSFAVIIKFPPKRGIDRRCGWCIMMPCCRKWWSWSFIWQVCRNWSLRDLLGLFFAGGGDVATTVSVVVGRWVTYDGSALL
jgi:hypothetical protein